MISPFDPTVTDWLFRKLRQYSVLIILLTFLITILFLAYLPKLRFENRPGQLDLPLGDPIRAELDAFESQFQAGEVIIVGQEYSRPIGASDFECIRELTEKLDSVEGIQTVHSLTNAVGLCWTPMIVGHVLRPRMLAAQSILNSDSATSRYLSQLATHPLYGRNLISQDGRHSAFLLVLENSYAHGRRGIKDLQLLLTRIDEVIDQNERAGVKFHISGSVVLNVALQAAMRRDLRLFAPISLIAFLIILILIFRLWKVVLLGIVTALLALIWCLGILPMSNTPMSLGLSMIFPIILSMSLVYAVHYLACFTQHQPSDSTANKSMERCFGNILIPSLMCGITTIVGFISLGTSPLPGIRDVGIFVGLGILGCMWMANLFLPSAALWIKLPHSVESREGRADVIERIVNHLRNVIIRRPGRFVSIITVLTLAAGIGLIKLTIETNHLEYLKNETGLIDSFEFADKQFGGILPLEILLKVHKSKGPDAVNAMLKAESELRKLDGVGSVISAADIIEEAERTKPKGFGLKQPTFNLKRGMISEPVWRFLERPSVGSSYFIRSDSEFTFRIACRAHIMSSSNLHTLLSQVDSVCVKHLLAYTPKITGLCRYFTGVERYVIRTQIQSFALALAVTIVLLGLISGSWPTSIAVIIANVVPVILVLGAMGWLGIPLDITTVMIASIAIGVVVDDTLHLLYRYRLELNSGYPEDTSLQRAFYEVGRPVTAGTIILIIGFISLLPARFLPTAYFGGLSALTIFVAALCDLLLLPALMALFLRWRRSSGWTSKNSGVR